MNESQPHPIVKSLALSSEQLPAIMARQGDVFVTAGAGAGKTRTLVARYLARLAEGTPLRSITAITFTRKAAHEMRNRVRQEIGRYLSGAHDSEEKAAWMRHQSALDAARIGTIHNLCMEILRAHPAEAGIDPRFGVLGEAQMAMMHESAIDAGLTWASNDIDCRRLFDVYSEDALRDMLRTLLNRACDVQAVMRHAPAEWGSLWQAAVVARIQPIVDDVGLVDLFATLRDVRDAGDLVRALAAGDAQAPHLSAVLAAWDRLVTARRQEDWTSVLQSLLDIAVNLKPGKGAKKNWRGVDPKPVLKSIKELLEEVKLYLELGPSLAVDAMLADDMTYILAVFDHAHRSYEAAKKEAGALDFDDLEYVAIALLKERHDVRARWRGELQEIMVDEFQDTNSRQRDLLACLNGEWDGEAAGASDGKLFVVGDAKQSIYRFRGAEVNVFREHRVNVQKSIEGGKGALVDMATSYRAHAALVHAMNDLIRPVMGEDDDPQQPWREPFSPLQPHRNEVCPGFTGPPVELHLTLGSKSAALGQCARAVTARILELVRCGAQMRDGDGYRPLRFDDIAVLCRASGSFGAYEDAFEAAGVPFLTVAGRGFYERPEVRDVLNQLRAVYDPADDVALAGLLRSPAFGVSDAGLYHLRAGEHGNKSLWDALKDAASILSDEDLHATQKACAQVEQWRKLAGRVSVSALLKRMIDNTHYRAILVHAGKGRAARNLAKLISDAANSNMVGVSEFLEYIDNVKGVGTREGEARSTHEGAVQIMSVHAAKGLEWPVVIIGDFGYASPNRMDLLIDPKAGILLPTRPAIEGRSARYCLAHEEECLKELAESIRLFYVAATRAQELLILSGTAQKSAKGELGGLKGWLDALNETGALALKGIDVATYQEDGINTKQHVLACGKSAVRCHIHEPNHITRVQLQNLGYQPTGRQTVDGIPDNLHEPLKVTQTQVQDQVRRVTVTRIQSQAPAWLVGTLVHELIAGWLFDTTDVSAWLATRARAYGLIDSVLQSDAVSRAESVLQRFRAHPIYAELVNARTRMHEVPYVLPGEAGVIDLLYQTSDGWHLLDFKTDVVLHPDKLGEWVVQQGYADQVMRYQQAASLLLESPVRARLCLLNVNDQVVLVDSVGL